VSGSRSSLKTYGNAHATTQCNVQKDVSPQHNSLDINVFENVHLIAGVFKE
jgi:hypothetical protein